MLEIIKKPDDIKNLSKQEIIELAEEIRRVIISTTACNGGHIAPSLGVVELTLALMMQYNLPQDKIIWDVGHQSYAYKMLTGRYEYFSSLRKENGITGFNNMNESEYDAFGVGHASTSISAALGYARARDVLGENYKTIAVIGDGAFTGGLAMEAMNNAGSSNTDITVILNDNGMSIAKNVGAISAQTTKIISSRLYNNVRGEIERLLGSGTVASSIKTTLRSIKGAITPGRFFEDFGFRYFGPIDGHNLEELNNTFKKIQSIGGPKFVHVLTKKGKGYAHAEKNSSKFHGIGAFDKNTGLASSSVCEGEAPVSYSSVSANAVVELARKHKDIVAIVAAMTSGTGTTPFQQEFPDRFYDVGIAEGHAVTYAAAMAAGKTVPYVFLYSTFMQRAFDHMIHDVALQKLPVVFCIDRAGLVGEDGPTHHGVFDIGYFGMVPNITYWSPCDIDELEAMMLKSYDYAKEHGPLVIRYPRGAQVKKAKREIENYSNIDIKSKNVVLAIGITKGFVQEIVPTINSDIQVVNFSQLYPIDLTFINRVLECADKIAIVEENVGYGSFGANLLTEVSLSNRSKINLVSLPNSFIEQASRDVQLENAGLKGDNLKKKLENFFC